LYGKTKTSKNQRQILTSTKIKNISDFVYWGTNASNQTPSIVIPDYHSTLLYTPKNSIACSTKKVCAPSNRKQLTVLFRSFVSTGLVTCTTYQKHF
jgi:hypothetical protein